jgi:hypothetical protein
MRTAVISLSAQFRAAKQGKKPMNIFKNIFEMRNLLSDYAQLRRWRRQMLRTKRSRSRQ